MSIQLSHEVTQKSLAISSGISVLDSSCDVFPIDLAITVLVKPIKDEVQDSLAAH